MQRLARSLSRPLFAGAQTAEVFTGLGGGRGGKIDLKTTADEGVRGGAADIAAGGPGGIAGKGLGEDLLGFFV